MSDDPRELFEKKFNIPARTTAFGKTGKYRDSFIEFMIERDTKSQKEIAKLERFKSGGDDTITGYETAHLNDEQKIQELEGEVDRQKKIVIHYKNKSSESNNLAVKYCSERNELEKKNSEWSDKAKVWLASPDAMKKLDGYRELSDKIVMLGKAMDDALILWVVRDGNNRVFLSDKEPTRMIRYKWWETKGKVMLSMPSEYFPGITWESEPAKVRLVKEVKLSTCTIRTDTAKTATGDLGRLGQRKKLPTLSIAEWLRQMIQA